jgi:putative cardiolipin synthase
MKRKHPAISCFRDRLTFVLLTGFILLFAGCAHIPKDPDKPVSYSAAPADEGMLADVSRDILSGQDETHSAFLMIEENDEALKWRLALIDHAVKSIDLQVFIWTNDESGRLLLSRIISAAERGVQVRLLLDDMPKDWSDRVTALIARADNIQVRRFNPGRVRKGLIGRTLQMSTQFQTLNRRMHNKQLIVDGHWGIVGGRNIGNPYFGLSKKYNNRDLDLLMTGAIIHELAADFDEYWNAPAAYPGEAMYKQLTAEQKEKARRNFDKMLADDKKLLRKTTIPVEPQDWDEPLNGLKTNMVFGVAEALKDSPEVKGDRGVRLGEQLQEAAPENSQVSCIITPYLIPSKEQLATIEKASREGRRVRFLVPSLESNNHTMVHSHYRKYRKRLLKAGAELYELRGDPSDEMKAMSDTPPIKSKFISLHTKAFVLDNEWVLLGSLNIDPRSIQINTEHMLVIESPDLAMQLREDFEWMIGPSNAWKVTLNERGKLRWNSDEGELKKQPARGMGQRIKDSFYRWLPIEGQL